MKQQDLDLAASTITLKEQADRCMQYLMPVSGNTDWQQAHDRDKQPRTCRAALDLDNLHSAQFSSMFPVKVFFSFHLKILPFLQIKKKKVCKKAFSTQGC